MKWWVLIVGLPVVALAYFLYLAWKSQSPPGGTGLTDTGQLRPCPNTPNCVVSENAEGEHRMEPLALEGVDPVRAWPLFVALVRDMGGRVVEQQGDYLWVTFSTPLFRYVDDLEARLDPEQGLIQLRSASRVGRSDLGANRARVDRLRAALRERLISLRQETSRDS